ncbi:MAG: HAD-IIB family hydrolase [Porticoccaceae bacterium]|jgi:mannosyl-3-phosphoglycerate phosphatase
MLKPSIQPIIFTDLDGTLLDHYSYSFEAAIPMLDKLEQLDIPVIPITSKTFAEVSRLRDQLNNRHPFIVENGAAIAIPKDYFDAHHDSWIDQGDFWICPNSKPRKHWNQLLSKNAEAFVGEYETFTSVVEHRGYQGLQEITGLNLAQAILSNERNYSEPIHWLGSDSSKQAFIKTLTNAGGTLLQGGRFLALGDAVDKGSTLLQLTEIYQTLGGFSGMHSLALGDSGNDVSMLEIANSAVIIKSQTHDTPALNRQDNLYVSNFYGPEGWAESVSLWLKNF